MTFRCTLLGLMLAATQLLAQTPCNPPIPLTFRYELPPCPGGLGEVKVLPPVPINSYSYLWDGGATTRILSGVAAGNYSVTVTHIATGCTTSGTATLLEPVPLTATVSTVNIKCFGESNGKAIALPVGGTGSKSYLWGDGSESKKIENLAAGTYSVVVTDSKGCTASASGTVTAPASAVAIEAIVNGTTVILTGSGGTPFTAPDLYRFCKVSNSGGCGFGKKTEFTNVSLPATFRVKDANQCIAETSVAGPEPLCLEMAVWGGPQSGTLTAPSGAVFTSVVFAKSGTVQGSCHNYSAGWCNNDHEAQVAAMALGQNSVTINLSDFPIAICSGGFGGFLAVELAYSFLKPSKDSERDESHSSIAGQVCKIYPNPSAEGIFNFETEEEISELQVFDAYGKLVLQPQPSEKTIRLDSQPVGIYFLKMKTWGGVEQVLKLSKI